MSKAVNSPTGRLLRNSRLFSLPPPLPPAPLEGGGLIGLLRSSDTATQPYPIRQAIATPKSSRHRGDWGLKRPLPQKSTSSSTPHLRITAIDNDAHITDFESAADHTQNLAKWQEMNIVMNASFEKRDHFGSSSSSSREASKKSGPTSAFDESVDNTIHVSALAQARPIAPEQDGDENNTIGPGQDGHGNNTNHNAFTDINKLKLGPKLAMMRHNLPEAQKRWKSEGPWLAGMTEDEFHSYLKTLRNHRQGFIEFVGNVVRQEKRKAEEARVQQERGISEEDMAEIEAASQLRAGELEAAIKTLREGEDGRIGFSSPMANLVREYLDLPGFSRGNRKEGQESAESPVMLVESMDKLAQHVRDMDIQPPPVTHLSGGLSYIRTKAYLENHPVWGPQINHSPIEARVVRPRLGVGTTARDKQNFFLGVGGFVTADPAPSNPTSFKPLDGSSASPTEHLQDVEGGTKVWVTADQAYIDKEGRVHIQFAKAQSEAVGVKTGNIPENRLHDIDPLAHVNFPRNEAAPGTPENGNYGTSLPGSPGQAMNRYQPYRPRQPVQPFGSDRNSASQVLADQRRNDY
ncbi:hypothetical protein MBLNU457_6561t1 [Dothideomycetes sp. NU457]